MIRLHHLVALAALALLSVAAFAQTPPVPATIKIEVPWLRATPNGARVAAGYAKITNAGTAPDRLVGGAVPFAEKVEVHEMATNDGVMKMRALTDGLAIPPGQSIELKPSGLHLMFEDLKNGLKEGEMVRGSLRFEKAGDVPVAFIVGGIGSSSPGPAMGDMKHGR